MSPRSRCGAALSQHPRAAVAAGEAIGGVLDQLDPHPSLAVIMVSGSHVAELDGIVTAVRTLLAPELLIGSTAWNVFGGPAEASADHGLALWAVATPEPLEPIRLMVDDDATMTGFPDRVAPGSTALLMAHRAFPVDRLRAAVERSGDGISLVGGLAVAGRRAGPARLLDGDGTYTGGAVGVVVPPGLATVSEFGTPWGDDADAGEPDGNRNVPAGVIDVGPGAGALLFADRGVPLAGGPTLDFEIVFDRFRSTVAGMVSSAFCHPRLDGCGGSGPAATAMIFQ